MFHLRFGGALLSTIRRAVAFTNDRGERDFYVSPDVMRGPYLDQPLPRRWPWVIGLIGLIGLGALWLSR